MSRVYEIDGVRPVVHPTSFVHPDAILIGDVIIGAHCYIGPAACLRGDFGTIEIGNGANVQDTCVIHSFPGKIVTVADYGHIGHGAVLHGCTIERNALVGMNAVVMDGAVIGESAIVAACSFVKADFVLPSQSLAAGSPAKVMRALTEQEVNWKTSGTEEYVALAMRSAASMKAVEPLTEKECHRPALKVAAAHQPLSGRYR
ncbi:transferase hexapeptide repeat family protein [Spongiibacter sp. KMU-166]|uniref:Transferase hexapeptide repeat family protein n=1 Tax=Spongiibacter thalassae TaxID=2721624 RepID=A0ABX1GHG7_9GAMM|nr:transferase hexapeptide repeat family protein [Spongiibacter thalassae]NKI18664.1 transferase hexapeptide repeat family protein [Spongiibacter thalassae]